MNSEERWRQRFINFEYAFAVFDRRVDAYRKKSTDEANQMSLVQSYEIIIELAWKTLKDYLQTQGYHEVRNGKQAIRQAFQDNLISEPEVWMLALEIRNETSHTYNKVVLKKVLDFATERFHPILRDLNKQLKQL